MSFTDGAARLAGLAGMLFGWTPDTFWRATPAELAAMLTALAGDAPAPPDPATIARMRQEFPDG